MLKTTAFTLAISITVGSFGTTSPAQGDFPFDKANNERGGEPERCHASHGIAHLLGSTATTASAIRRFPSEIVVLPVDTDRIKMPHL